MFRENSVIVTYNSKSLLVLIAIDEVRVMESSKVGVIGMDVSDNELIERFVVHKDQLAFSTLVLRFQGQLQKYATRLCNGDVHTAEDVVQETFLRAFLALANFRGESKLSTWLYRITFNLAMRNHRTNRLQPGHCCELEDIAELVDEVEHFEQLEVERDLAAAMTSISGAQQKVISLCVINGYSHEHVAHVTGMPLGTVKTNILRGKVQLKNYLSAWREAA